jgi:hypothetical protein
MDQHSGGSATLAVSSLEDNFDDFASAPPNALLGDLATVSSMAPLDTYEPGKPTPMFRAKYVRVRTLLLGLVRIDLTPAFWQRSMLQTLAARRRG